MKKYYCGLGWKYNIPSHLDYFQELAYSLADKGYVLRTTTNKGGSAAFIRGVQRYCTNRKLKIEDYLEVYMPTSNHNGVLSDQPGFHNIQHFKNLNDSKKITKNFGENGIEGQEKEFRLLTTIPYICLGEELNNPCQFLITDIKLFKMDEKGIIFDGHGISGQAIRTLNTLSPKTQIFNFDHDEHRQRLNNLLYHAKN